LGIRFGDIIPGFCATDDHHNQVVRIVHLSAHNL
jgi:hypothetical protein